ncbi:hypothetical protein PVAP13_6NG165700 [Panicum virgatum]|uniref:Multiprotein bridging factor 1 N-terminal domain-containing protein n=1 Tax=Panicum virgatum TaxID=38727 RepID=A0A8T0QXK3_PANVG|nr:hypothetical protein PVAP13_6NG165700 [Panicum virgatum]
MAGIGPIRQDWEPVVVRKKAPTAAAKKDEKAVNAARRSGAEIDTMKKYNAGTNKAASSGTSFNTKRLDDDTENLAHERVPSDLKKNLMQARLDKKMTQAQLAQVMIIGVWPSNKWGNLLFSDSNEWQHNIKVDVSQKILSFPKMR